jgi:multiple sugar transport system ATP-binding protein
MTLGTRVAVLKDGELMQVNTPQSLFDAPDNLFVATFIGSPSMNLAEARLVRDQGPAVVFADYAVPIPEGVIADHPGLDRYLDRRVIIGVRPSSFEDAALAQVNELPRIKADVAVAEELGSEVNVIFTVHAPPVQHEVMIAKFDKAAKDHLETKQLAGEGDSMWTAQVDPRTSARRGGTVDLTIDVASLHWFDPHSGQAIGRAAGGDVRRTWPEPRSAAA